jgi:hypothetical protein
VRDDGVAVLDDASRVAITPSGDARSSLRQESSWRDQDRRTHGRAIGRA